MRSALRYPGPVCPALRAVITIDTEPDDAWYDHLCPSVQNVRALHRMAALLRRFGAPATLLVTYRVIQDPECVDLLRGLVTESGAEVGAHLHPWETPPFMDSGADVRHATYPHELPLTVFTNKLTCLTEAIAERIGRPTSYRGGRWGLAAEHLQVLESLGYEVDSSVMPLKDWRSTPGIPFQRNGCGGLDYRFAPRVPYHPSYQDVTRPGTARLVEVPVTVGFRRPLSLAAAHRYARLPALAQRILHRSGLFRPVWAAPAWESQRDLLNMLDGVLCEGLPVVNLIFHSSEFVINRLPECDTVEKVDAILGRTEALLESLAGCGRCEFTTLTAAGRSSGGAAGAPASPSPRPAHACG
jgi:peptidoglycan/xylan/chitin deacetylase (PgdA/CDA1 family)